MYVQDEKMLLRVLLCMQALCACKHNKRASMVHGKLEVLIEIQVNETHRIHFHSLNVDFFVFAILYFFGGFLYNIFKYIYQDFNAIFDGFKRNTKRKMKTFRGCF